MADGSENGPATVSPLEVGEATSLACVPLVDAHGDFAGEVAAADASEDFVCCVHSMF